MVNTAKDTKTSTKRRLRRKGKIALIILGAILVAIGVFVYALYGGGMKKATTEQQASEVIASDPVLSLRDFSDEKLATEYLSIYKKGDTGAAHELYRKPLQSNKGAVAEYALLTDCYRISMYAKDGRTAVLAAERLYELYPDIDHTVMLANAYGLVGDVAKQIEYLEKARAMDPQPEVQKVIEKDIEHAKEGR